jgi:hypothetical protein
MNRRTFLAALAALAFVPAIVLHRRAGGRTVIRDGWILDEDDA